MKTPVVTLFIAVSLMTRIALSQTTAFTYQGRLMDGGLPAEGNYDLQFTLLDAVTAGTTNGGPLVATAVSVTNGLFAVTLDFGTNAFNGSDRWLELGVRTNGSVQPYSVLAPRQAVTPTPYALLALRSASVVNGSITTASIAPGSINASSIQPGTITSNLLAPGAVNVTSLAKPYQSGSISLESLGNATSFAPTLITTNITFPTSFSSPPIVSTTLETGLEAASADIGNLLVSQKTTSGFKLSFTLPNLPVPIASQVLIPFTITPVPLIVVNNRPASAYTIRPSGLYYSRSADAVGQRWASPVLIQSTLAKDINLLMISGQPAIAFIDSGNNLKYVRANDTDGTSWPAPLTIQAAGGGFVAGNISTTIIGGRPAIACWSSSTNQIFYYRANDTNGTSWPASGTLVTNGNKGISLAEISGRPAISFGWDNGLPDNNVGYAAQLRYVRANDSAGATWPATQVTIVSGGVFVHFADTTLAAVATNPAVIFRYSSGNNPPTSVPRFVRSTDTNGTAWASPVNVANPIYVGQFVPLVTSNKIGVAWTDNSTTTYNPLHFSESINNGASFSLLTAYARGFPVAAGFTYVQGQPAISFVIFDSNEVVYIRDGNPVPDTFINWIAVAP